jgi:methyltransferase (TIGR00027 family)
VSSGPLSAGAGMTALGLARARAAESERPDRLFADPLAAAFVAAGSAGGRGGRPPADPSPEQISAWMAMADYFAVRTRFFDDHLLAACEVGGRQVVLLGAGLDTRAFRLPWPTGVRLFEVDLPEVLRFKESVLAERAAMPACERVTIPADLRGDWSPALAAAGLDASLPVAWLAEGLLRYVEEDEGDRLLRRAGELSAAGSRLALEGTGQALLLHSLPADVPMPGSRRPVRTDPVGWLAGLGWQAQAWDAAETFVRYGRPVPAPLDASVPGAVRGWLATATRVERPA